MFHFSQVELPWQTIETLDHVVNQLFCVRTHEMESATDKFLTSVIRTVIDMGTTQKDAVIVKVIKQFHDFSKTG